MSGYTLVNKLRKTRRRYPLTAIEQALYHELVAICNDDEWPDSFPCSNEGLCSALMISENTLNSARNTLIQCGLIAYRSGKSKRQFGSYSFPTTSTDDTNAATNAATDRGANAATNPATNAADYNKTKRERKTKTGSGTNVPGGDQVSSGKNSEEERKKSSAQKKKDVEGTPHWPAMVKVWFDFYEKAKGHKPTFDGQAPKSLKKICDNLEKRAGERKVPVPWDEQTAVATLTAFLTHAAGISWLADNFLLPNLERQFDKIISEATNGNSKTRKQSAGADYERELAERLRQSTSQG